MNEAAIPEPRQRETVLIIDDSAFVRVAIRSQFGRSYRVIEAETGAEGLAAFEREQVDLVLLDVILPDMNGYEICRKVKSDAKRGFVPVMLLTALASQDDRNAGLAAGADEFVTKPFDPTE